MRHRSGQLPGGIAGKLGVGIERDHVLDRGKDARISHDFRKAVPGTSAKKGVELRKLSPLSFVTHPNALAGIPSSRPVEQEKHRVASGRIPQVQHLHPGPRTEHEGFVPGHDLRARIAEVGQQGEVQVLVPVREMVDLQGLDQV